MPKLVQLNIWGGRLENTLIDYFTELKPDIVCLQEAISFDKPNAAFFYTIEQLQKAGELPYVLFAPAFSFRLMRGNAQFGNCILSRYPILRSEVVFTRLNHNENFDFNHDDYNMRNFAHAVIEINKKHVNVITHHGHHVREHKNGTAETNKQMAQLHSYIRNLVGPVILTGDFNLHPKSTSLKQLNKNLRNLSVEHKLNTTRNTMTHKKEVCDYIYINDRVKLANFSMADQVVSDHAALVMNFSV